MQREEKGEEERRRKESKNEREEEREGRKEERSRKLEDREGSEFVLDMLRLFTKRGGLVSYQREISSDLSCEKQSCLMLISIETC